jgi:hypothetical protein
MFNETSANNVAILVTSCDKYHDLWDPFFTLFFRYWPDCPYPVYLGTNHLKYNDKRVKTITTSDDDWSSRFRTVFEKIPEPYVIVMNEDFFLTKPVDTVKIEELIRYMVAQNSGCLRLFPCPGPDLSCLDNPEVGEISKGADYRLSLQAAIWNKQTLLELLREGESAWELEINGTKRTNDLDVPFLCVTGDSPIPYFCTGVVKGKWVREAVELCKKEGIEVDLTVRSVQTPVDRFLRSEIISKLIGFIKNLSFKKKALPKKNYTVYTIKSYLIKLIKSALEKENNQTRWEMLFILEQLLSGGKNRRIVTSAIVKRVRTVIGFYLPSPYRPKGVINSVEQWFNDSDSIPPQMEGSGIKDIIPESTVYLKKPNHINDEIHPAFSECGKSDLSPKAYLCFFKNARLVNENGVAISYDDKVFADFTFEFGTSIEEHEVFKSYISKPQVRRECLATITSTGNTGYFHWIFESLPRLKLLEEVIDEIDYLIVPYNLKRFHLETLNLLGFPEEKLLKIKDGTNLQCERLFVPYLLRGVHKWACDFLRDSFIPKDLAKPHRLIYISRKDALYRKIVNEEEVEDYLRDVGFEIVQMSELTFLEQVRICAEAQIVVGPHGAGLSNTVFCRNAKILEIFSPSYGVSFFSIANQVGNEYYYLLGKDAPGNSPPPWRDFKVDMETFEKTLEWILRGV